MLLAAGIGSRFEGTNALLVELGGEPLVKHAARTLLDPECDVAPVVAVVGHESARVRGALAGLDLHVVDNPVYREGQATSVRAGLAAGGDADAALFALGDMPFVLPRSVSGIVDRSTARALATRSRVTNNRERGNPVLFGATHFDALANVEGDTGGREVLLASEDAALVETGDPGVLVDVDRPEDLETFE